MTGRGLQKFIASVFHNRPTPICTALLLTLAVLQLGASDKLDSLSALPSKVLMEEGRSYFESRDAEESLTRFMIVADRYEKGSAEDRELAVRAMNNAGCVYKFFYYNYTDAYDCLTMAKERCEKEGDEKFLPVVLVNLGDLLRDYAIMYNSPEIEKESEDLFRDCFKKSVASGNWELMATSFFNVSNGNYEINLKEYADIFSDKIPTDTPDIEYVRLLYKGIESLQKGDYKQARTYFHRQFDAINTTMEVARDSISSYGHIAETYIRENDIASAIDTLETALRKAEASNLTDISANIASLLTELYDRTGDKEKAREYKILYLEKREQLHNSRLGSIGEQKYISDLKKEKTKVSELSFRQKYLRLIVICLIIIAAFLIAFGIVIRKKNKVLGLRNQSLYEKYQQLMEAEVARNDNKYTRSSLDDTKKEKLIDSIKEKMEDPELICSPDFTLKNLAVAVDSNTTYVSRVINETYGLSFSTLLGNTRVRYVCKKIKEGGEFDKMTVEGIANSVGFRSRTSFINAFKREVGMTPSDYIKMALAEKNS